MTSTTPEAMATPAIGGMQAAAGLAARTRTLLRADADTRGLQCEGEADDEQTLDSKRPQATVAVQLRYCM